MFFPLLVGCRSVCGMELCLVFHRALVYICTRYWNVDSRDWSFFLLFFQGQFLHVTLSLISSCITQHHLSNSMAWNTKFFLPALSFWGFAVRSILDLGMFIVAFLTWFLTAFHYEFHFILTCLFSQLWKAMPGSWSFDFDVWFNTNFLDILSNLRICLCFSENLQLLIPAFWHFCQCHLPVDHAFSGFRPFSWLLAALFSQISF